MKIKYLFFIIIFLNLSCIFADEYIISKLNCVEPENYYKRELLLKYDDEDDVYYLYKSTYSHSYWYTLTAADLDKFRTNVEKAKEWINIAKKNKVSVKKELPDSELSVEGAKKSGNDWYFTRWDIDISFLFAAGFENDKELFILLLEGGESESSENMFIDIEFESVFFMNDQIYGLSNAISKETVEKAKLKHEEDKKTADMFN